MQFLLMKISSLKILYNGSNIRSCSQFGTENRIESSDRMERASITQYEEAKQAVADYGLLPLSSYIADYPSLESLTPKENWHSETEADPWIWRVRLADEKAAAYGKFFKKKPTFISLELFPYIRSLRGDQRSIQERYEAGIVSRAAHLIYRTIEEKGITDARTLRGLVGMKAKEEKTSFDNALVELQESFDLIITGSRSRDNADGTNAGWNSMSFELTDRWFAGLDEVVKWYPRDQAREFVLHYLEPKCSETARKQLHKILT